MDDGEWFEREDGTMFWWPRCEIPGCPNHICLSKGETRFCWPHSGSGSTLDSILNKFRRKKVPV